tara:strand:- start:403 stop:636 length:234 start_codon:yes stop_codon:yes gene_type:complete
MGQVNLKEYLQQHYGSIEACADAIEVSRRTVYNYIAKNPEGVLRHASRLIEKEGVDVMQLLAAVVTSQVQLGEAQLS